jgi:hypothetical protein
MLASNLNGKTGIYWTGNFLTRQQIKEIKGLMEKAQFALKNYGSDDPRYIEILRRIKQKNRRGVESVTTGIGNGISQEKFMELWGNRSMRELADVHPYETRLQEIMPPENHFPYVTKVKGENTRYNFAGPKTDYYGRQAGNDVYISLHPDNAHGINPYDTPIDGFDACALMHDCMYSCPFATSEHISICDELVRSCWESDASGTFGQKVKSSSSGAAFRLKGLVDSSGGFSSSHERNKNGKYESQELLELEKLREWGRGQLQREIERASQTFNPEDPEPLLFNEEAINEKFPDFVTMGKKLGMEDGVVEELYHLYGEDMAALSQLLRVFYYEYDDQKKTFKARSGSVPAPDSIVGGSRKRRRTKRRRTKRRRTKRRRTKKRRTQKRRRRTRKM